MSGDLIIRVAAMDKISEHCAYCNVPLRDASCGGCIVDAIAGEIEKLPAVDAEPVRHSRMSKPKIKRVEPMCLECHIAYVKDPAWNYCPYCGAKLDGGADG